MKVLIKLSRCCTRKTLVISAIIMVLFMAVILPYEAAIYRDISNGLSAPDTQFFLYGRMVEYLSVSVRG